MTAPAEVRPARGASGPPLARGQGPSRGVRRPEQSAGSCGPGSRRTRSHPGESLGLVGESGSGKSVSALSLLGLLPKKVSQITAGTRRVRGDGT